MVPNDTIELRPEETDDALELAYDASLKTYDWMLRRVDAWDGNIDRILALGVPITLAVNAKAAMLVLSKGGLLEGVGLLLLFVSLYLIGAALYSGFKGKDAGVINLINPEKLFQNWLEQSKREYHHWTIYFAGQDFSLNRALVDAKASRAADCVKYLMTAALIAAITWFFSAVT